MTAQKMANLFVEQFITALYKMPENGDYDKFVGLRDEMVRDQLVWHAIDKNLCSKPKENI